MTTLRSVKPPGDTREVPSSDKNSSGCGGFPLVTNGPIRQAPLPCCSALDHGAGLREVRAMKSFRIFVFTRCDDLERFKQKDTSLVKDLGRKSSSFSNPKDLTAPNVMRLSGLYCESDRGSVRSLENTRFLSQLMWQSMSSLSWVKDSTTDAWKITGTRHATFSSS